jgi:hypothetical protein
VARCNAVQSPETSELRRPSASERITCTLGAMHDYRAMQERDTRKGFPFPRHHFASDSALTAE